MSKKLFTLEFYGLFNSNIEISLAHCMHLRHDEISSTHLVHSSVVIFERGKRASEIIAVSKVTAIGRLTAVCFQMFPQIYQVLATEDKDEGLL